MLFLFATSLFIAYSDVVTKVSHFIYFKGNWFINETKYNITEFELRVKELCVCAANGAYSSEFDYRPAL